jgi:HEAT repeat protein
MTMKKTFIQLAAVAILVVAPQVVYAGKGGSAARIQAAVTSGSIDAILAEVERAESLLCEECIDTMTRLTEDSRFAVREVAAWWFARRPALKDMLVSQFSDELSTGDTTKVRNAADFLGATRSFNALPQLRAAIHRADLGVDARLALVRAAGYMAHVRGNEVLTTAMADRDASVRAAAVVAWHRVLDQSNAQPVVPLLRDGDAEVRAQAAGVVGGMAEQSARASLEALVVGDPDPGVRRNAAWALGQLGNGASRAVLSQALSDGNMLVRGTARMALANIH